MKNVEVVQVRHAACPAENHLRRSPDGPVIRRQPSTLRMAARHTPGTCFRMSGVSSGRTAGSPSAS